MFDNFGNERRFLIKVPRQAHIPHACLGVKLQEMANATEEQLAKLRGIMGYLKAGYMRLEASEEVDKLNMLDMVMCIHQALEVLAEIVEPE